MIVASDLNGTLTTGSPILAVARWVKKNHPDSYPDFFIPGLLVSYIQVRLGWKKIDTWGDKNMRRVLELIPGSSPEIVDAVMTYVVDEELWKKRRQKPVSLLEEYHHSGAEIIIISAAFEPAVQKFALKIGHERVIGLGTEVMQSGDGLLLSETLTSREIKLEKIRAVIGSAQIDVALGDTFADIPLLENAILPIAVYPDKKLHEMAVKKGWKIIQD